ncbi:NADP-dependent oxidoreductase domain-containing protein [Fimicolochytrium jonesii]|uniref:NADP-dependent oxidoreductase domain-containing protein n=1 Tax=Fimicolochytrium jonesii TaxID=1396493 RepID=UPI0022FEB413|nr:NADP-dependent oxidoreductase domain-containing protein [Fimicolochytrium jonesii]KAI8815614.1 NADP-dependent oxidoreductase domain-containing protein [Fimicolochytrium jonesii]
MSPQQQQQQQQGSKPRVILGTMTFGTGVGGRISDQKEIQRILDLYASHGHKELDTARMYCGGNTEEVLGEMNVQNSAHSFSVATKAYPTNAGDHEPSKLKAQFRASLKALKTKKVDIFYLHAPDHATPFADTLKAVQELYEEGTFGELALSNYAAWEVMQIWWICKSNGYVLPTLYQGMYNALVRDCERELFPCLRELGIRFYAYNPLCGGLMSGKYKFETNPDEGRFDPNHSQGERYRQRYWNKLYFEAIESLKAVCEQNGLTTVEVAHRWLARHSKLDFNLGDGIIIGASSYDHAKQNLEDCAKGPLPEAVVKAFDKAWEDTKVIAPTYFR